MSIRLELEAGTCSALEGETSEAFVRLSGNLATGVILLCDHAENALPEEYGTLGLAPSEFERHIAYDIGVREVTKRLAATLGAPAVMTRFSRLLIDCNRGEDDPTLIMRLSDGAIVPGNRLLTPDERAKRVARYYRPYHAEIDAVIDLAASHGIAPVLLSVHSFTPVWRGLPRPWHGAVLWDKDPRLAKPLLAELSLDPSLVIGDNAPYDGALRGDCLWQHGTSRGLAHALVEIRQDLIADETGQIEWSERLADAMRRILATTDPDANLWTRKFFGSRTD